MTFIAASPKQSDFIAGLAAAKAIPADAAEALFTAARAQKIGKDKASDLIDSLMGEDEREVPEGIHVAPEGSPWEGQRLVVKRAKTGRLYATTEGGEYLNGQGLFRLTDSTLVGAAPTISDDVPEGIHVTEDGDFRRVQRSRAGNLYAMGLSENGKFNDYLGKAGLAGLSEETKITAEQAAEFGHHHGRCIFCAKTLTDERSVSVGYGETCASNQGLPWG